MVDELWSFCQLNSRTYESKDTVKSVKDPEPRV